MKKKNVIILIVISILLTYIINLLVLYGASQNITDNDLLKKADDFYGAYPIDSNPEKTTEELLKQIMFSEISHYRNDSFPYVAAIYDTNGNLLTLSTSMLRVSVSGKEYFCFLDDYLNENMKNEIVDFARGKENLLDGASCRFSFNIENDIIIPVRLSVTSLTGNNKNLDLLFSQENPQYNQEIGFNDFQVSAELYSNNLYKELFEKVNNFNPKEMEHFYFWSSEDVDSNNQVSSFTNFNIRNEVFYIYEISGYESITGVITSEIFKTFFFQETVLFCIVGVFLLVVVNMVFNKNERLEKSRIAFTGAAAHELKTPLAVTANLCECVIENILPEKNNEYISSIYDETRRMSKMVATLLRYNRINSVKVINKTKNNVSDIMKTELQKYDTLINDKGIAVETQIEDEVYINCNAELIELVIDNYLSNAIKHSDDNGVIRASVLGKRGKAVVSVYNKGKQISKENAKHIWEEFYREDKARNSKDNSTGMGLAICKNILERHNYKYGFKNIDNGVEFNFTAKQTK